MDSFATLGMTDYYGIISHVVILSEAKNPV